jgi:predicted Zn-dependent peptidase
MSDKPYISEKINGIQTVFFPLDTKRAILAEVWIHAGSWYETEKWGGFHLLEHMCHQGTAKFKSVQSLETYKEMHGLRANAFTGSDVVGFWSKGPFYSLEPILTYLSQVALQPTVPQNKLDKEIDVIRQEYHDVWDNPFRRFDRAINQQMFGADHPYAKDAIGQPEYFAKLNRTDLVKMHQQYFTADNMIMVVTGNFEVKKAEKLIEKLFTPALTAKRDKLVIPKPKTDYQPHFHKEDMAQDRVALSWLIPGLKQLPLRERAVLKRANYILGGSSRSILFNEIREKRGLAYGAGSSISFRPDYGQFEIGTSTNPDNRQKVIKLFRSILKKFLAEPIKQITFDRAQAYLSAQNMMAFDSLSDIGSYILDDLFYEDRIYLPEEYLEIVKTITKEEVKQSFKKLIDPEKGILSIMSKTT